VVPGEAKQITQHRIDPGDCGIASRRARRLDELESQHQLKWNARGSRPQSSTASAAPIGHLCRRHTNTTPSLASLSRRWARRAARLARPLSLLPLLTLLSLRALHGLSLLALLSLGALLSRLPLLHGHGNLRIHP
jgi:hypothetical protein